MNLPSPEQTQQWANQLATIQAVMLVQKSGLSNFELIQNEIRSWWRNWLDK